MCILSIIDWWNWLRTGSYGCSKEACQFQTLTENEIFKRAGVRIVGVSSDSPEKQKAFVQENNLTVSGLPGVCAYCVI